MQRNAQRVRRIAGSIVTLIILLFLSIGGTLWQPVVAQSGITSPAPGSSVSGDVTVIGTAVIDPFQKYELHFKLEPSGDDAYVYFTGNTVPVQNGPLGVWQTGGLPAGIYSLRLRVVKNDGNYAEFFAQNISVNQGPPQPSASPTSEPTDAHAHPDRHLHARPAAFARRRAGRPAGAGDSHADADPGGCGGYRSGAGHGRRGWACRNGRCCCCRCGR